jgi:hypothetical protein
MPKDGKKSTSIGFVLDAAAFTTDPMFQLM